MRLFDRLNLINTIPWSPYMFAGNPRGISIVDLHQDPERWWIYAQEQTQYLLNIGKCPDTADVNKIIRFGHLQHPEVKPMYGLTGPETFIQIRDKWNKTILNRMRESLKETQYYVSPFDGKLK